MADIISKQNFVNKTVEGYTDTIFDSCNFAQDEQTNHKTQP